MEVPRHLTIPKGWLEYCSTGSQVEGTSFVPCKVPLKDVYYDVQKIEEPFTPKLLKEKISNVGLVIDFTDTDRYYDGQEFVVLGVAYKKIRIPGRVVPPEHQYIEFRTAVDRFAKDRKDQLIVVHCTHGINRTGYMICRYMMEKLRITVDDAVERFNTARQHEMERYIGELRRIARKRPTTEFLSGPHVYKSKKA